MLRSALGRVSSRLSGPSAACSPARAGDPPNLAANLGRARGAVDSASRTSRSANENLHVSCRIPYRRSHCVSNLQGLQHFPVISKGAKGGNCSLQKRFLSVERIEPLSERVMSWLEKHYSLERQLALVMVAGVSSFVSMTILYGRLDKAPTRANNFRKCSCNCKDQ